MSVPAHIAFRVTFSGKELSVAAMGRSGSKELIVFLHGYPCSKELFHRVWSFPKFNNHSILCPDFVGFGDSDKPIDFPYSLEAHAAVLEQVLKQADAAAVHLVAHSMGAAIALLLPAQRMGTLASFANVEGNLLTAPEATDTPRKPRLPRKHEDLVLLREARGAASDEALRRTGESLAEWSAGGDLLSRFQSARCRKAYFHGDDLGQLRLADELQGCNPVQIPSASHFVMNDNPTIFYQELSRFIVNDKGGPAKPALTKPLPL